jgi:hypothetical protein
MINIPDPKKRTEKSLQKLGLFNYAIVGGFVITSPLELESAREIEVETLDLEDSD